MELIKQCLKKVISPEKHRKRSYKILKSGYNFLASQLIVFAFNFNIPCSIINILLLSLQHFLFLIQYSSRYFAVLFLFAFHFNIPYSIFFPVFRCSFSFCLSLQHSLFLIQYSSPVLPSILPLFSYAV
jgi:hypothetical protein